MGEQKIFSSILDSEAEFLLKEYEALRTEINSHIASQTQLTTVAIILLGGLTASVPFLESVMNFKGNEPLKGQNDAT